MEIALALRVGQILLTLAGQLVHIRLGGAHQLAQGALDSGLAAGGLTAVHIPHQIEAVLGLFVGQDFAVGGEGEGVLDAAAGAGTAVQKGKLDLVVLLQAHGDGFVLPAGFLHRQADGEAGHGQVHRLHGPYLDDKVHAGLIQQAGLLRGSTRAVKVVKLRGLQPGGGVVAAHEPFGQGVLHCLGQLAAAGAEHAFAHR